MTEQTNDTDLTDERKAELAEQERQARAWVTIQREEGQKADTDQAWKNLSTMSPAAARELVQRECGFDPGW